MHYVVSNISTPMTYEGLKMWKHILTDMYYCRSLIPTVRRQRSAWSPALTTPISPRPRPTPTPPPPPPMSKMTFFSILTFF